MCNKAHFNTWLFCRLITWLWAVVQILDSKSMKPYSILRWWIVSAIPSMSCVHLPYWYGFQHYQALIIKHSFYILNWLNMLILLTPNMALLSCLINLIFDKPYSDRDCNEFGIVWYYLQPQLPRMQKISFHAEGIKILHIQCWEEDSSKIDISCNWNWHIDWLWKLWQLKDIFLSYVNCSAS